MPEPEATPQPTEPTPEPQPTEPVEPTEPKATPAPPTWRDGFTTEDYKNNDNFKKYGSIDDMGKAHLELVSMIGKKGVVLPNDADPNDVERFYKQLGRPDTADKYETPEIEVDEQFKQFISDEKFEAFKNIAHKYGLTQKQFEGLSQEYTGLQLEEIKNVVHEENKRLEESTKELMNEWLVDYDANTKQSEMALKSFTKGISEEKLEILMRDPDIKRLGFNIAKSVSEDTFRKGDGGKSLETTQSLQSFIDSQVKDLQSSYYNQMAPDHKAARAKVKDSYARLEALRKGA